MPFRMVSCVPTADHPSHLEPGSIPTIIGWLFGSTSFFKMMQNMPSLFQYALALPWLSKCRALSGVHGINGFLFVSNTGTRIIDAPPESSSGNISLRPCKESLVF